MRVARGIYVRPRITRFAGAVPPSSEAILRLVAKGETITMSGVEAAQRLGLITQMVLKKIYWTSGANAGDQADKRGDHLSPPCIAQKVCPPWTPCRIRAPRPVGIGKDMAVLPAYSHPSFEIPPEEFQALKGAEMPRWMKETFYEEEKSHRLDESFRQLSSGEISRREFEDATGKEWWWGDILEELGKRNLPYPIANIQRTPAQQKLANEIF